MADEANQNGHPPAVPIEGIAKFSPAQIEALKSRWITTVDTMVAVAATKEGRIGLCEILGMDTDAFEGVLQEACDSLGEARYRDLLTPKPGGPTGALLDEEEQ